jgi:phosphohistidine phosphatase
VIWHSGKARARQTAEVLWKRCNALARFSAARGLQPEDPASWIVDALAGEAGDVMLVGHFPHLQRLLGWLRSRDPEQSAEDFPPHGLVALEEAGQGRWNEKWRVERPTAC